MIGTTVLRVKMGNGCKEKNSENKYEINKMWIFKAKNWTTSNNGVE